MLVQIASTFNTIRSTILMIVTSLTASCVEECVYIGVEMSICINVPQCETVKM